MINRVELAPDVLALAARIVEHELSVWWTEGPDSGSALIVGRVLVINDHELAGIVIGEDGMPDLDTPFIHIEDKRLLVEEVTRLKFNKLGG